MFTGKINCTILNIFCSMCFKNFFVMFTLKFRLLRVRIYIYFETGFSWQALNSKMLNLPFNVYASEFLFCVTFLLYCKSVGVLWRSHEFNCCTNFMYPERTKCIQHESAVYRIMLIDPFICEKNIIANHHVVNLWELVEWSLQFLRIICIRTFL